MPSEVWGARSISENRLSPWTTKEIRLMCPHCNGSLFVQVPVDGVGRQGLIQDAIEHHRRMCLPEDGRVYRIEYPRA